MYELLAHTYIELSILCAEGLQVKISVCDVFLSLIHLGLHCLPKYLFTDIQDENSCPLHISCTHGSVVECLTLD